ncbi:gamma-interferon-responsive lysosomal thiol protein [Quercus suber]|uniref:Gamma-interferon-responsive lysosomal thiol protein n=1 Tax=Quercus suber TaxID=58331 RepID=A0AAW0KND0_QUESU
MASNLVITLSLVSYLFFFTSSSSSASRIILPSDSQKVSVGLYYESLCPYSANFIINYLDKLFETDLISIVDLKLVPWGNAKLRANNTFDCQSEHFPFINCVETLVYEHKYPQWESCFEKLGLDPKPISDCFSSGHGKELELQYAAETNTLQPPHKYVPWVVVDGEPLYEDYENFLSYICKAYKGTAVSTACSKVSVNTVSGKAKVIHPDCYETRALALAARIKSAITRWMGQKNMVASIAQLRQLGNSKLVPARENSSCLWRIINY